MKLCVGIISYLPDNIELRNRRKVKIVNLIYKINYYLNLPIILITQNWDIDFINQLEGNLLIYKYEKPLGITGARSKLREVFLNSGYDYLIMSDDDLILNGDKPMYTKYINTIMSHPKDYGRVKPTSLCMSAISRDLYSKIEFPKLDPCKGEFFEDIWLNKFIDKNYPDRVYNLDCNFKARAAKDPESTWFHGQYHKHSMGVTTRGLL